MRDLASLTAADFLNRVGSTLAIDANGREWPIELIAVDESPAAGAGRQQFSLTFCGGPPEPLPQGIRRLTDSELGSLEIFLAPLGPGPAGQRYEAAFA